MRFRMVCHVLIAIEEVANFSLLQWIHGYAEASYFQTEDY
jgi:hypothetical protein